MAQNVVQPARRWSVRSWFRLRDSRVDRIQGIVFYAFALLAPLLLSVVPPTPPLIAFAAVGIPPFAILGTALLFRVPAQWERVAGWLHNWAPKWVYTVGVLVAGSFVVWSVDMRRTNAGLLAVCLALGVRTAASLTEPLEYALGERPYAGRIRRAALIHSGFMVFFAFGAAITLGSAVRAIGQAAPVGVYVSVAISTAAYFFKVQQKIRRTCVRTQDRIGDALRELAYLDSPKNLDAAIRVLDRTLAAPVETSFRLWGKPVAPPETRVKVIDWLDKRAAEGVAVRDSTDPEFQALLAIAEACSRWGNDD